MSTVDGESTGSQAQDGPSGDFFDEAAEEAAVASAGEGEQEPASPPSPIAVQLSNPLPAGQHWDDDSDIEELLYQRSHHTTPWAPPTAPPPPLRPNDGKSTDFLGASRVDLDQRSASSSVSVATVVAPGRGLSPDSWCFLCEIAYNRNEPGQEEMDILMQYIEEMFSKVHPSRFCYHVQQLYNNHLRQYTPNEPRWHKRTIYRHVTEHAPTATNAAHVCDTRLRKVLDVCGDEMVVADATSGRLSVVDSKVSAYLRVRAALGKKRKRGAVAIG